MNGNNLVTIPAVNLTRRNDEKERISKPSHFVKHGKPTGPANTTQRLCLLTGQGYSVMHAL